MNARRKIKHILNAIIRRGNWFKSKTFRDCQKFWTYNTFNTDVINLGSSSSVYAFCYDDIPVKAANWALSPNPLSGDFAILKNYCGYLNSKHSTVILPLCPFSSLAGNYSIFDDRYYTLLYGTTIPGYSYYREQRVVSMRNNPILYYPLIEMFKDIKYAIFGERNHPLNEMQMEKDSEMRLNSWMKEFSVKSFSSSLSLLNKDAIDEAARILNEIIDFCKMRNMRPVILVPPVYHTLGAQITPQARHQIIDSLVDKIKDKSVWFHNYMDDPCFTNDITLFQNSFFMNKKGAKLFTSRVLHDLGII